MTARQAGASKWVTIARRRQAEFRVTSPTISASARRPTDVRGQRHGHLLALGYEHENLIPNVRADARRFFKDRDIKWWRSPQTGDDKDQDGPTRNLTSSQVACVNFLLPLSRRPDALLAILRRLDSDVTGVVSLEYTAAATQKLVSSFVELEWVGLKSTLEGEAYSRGANATSADALIVALTGTGARRAYLFEWKYVEQYGRQKPTADRDRKNDIRMRRYKTRYEAQESPFVKDVSLAALLYDPFYQLMRFGLLGQKMIEENEFGVAEARVVVVCPGENTEYRTSMTSPALAKQFPNASSIEEILKQVWRDPSDIKFTDTAALVSASGLSGLAELDDWAAYNGTRYR